MAKPQITAPKGVLDVLDAVEGRRWRQLENVFFDLAARCGYPHLRFPIFEQTELFVRSVGEATDIVHKEMYTFEDAAGRSLTLRPEGTAGIVRAFVEAHLDQAPLPWKAAYFGPMFRAERKQRGRYRQFHQFGIEAIGVDDPALDVEVIELGWHFFAAIGLTDVTLKLNTIGDLDERREFVDDLRAYMMPHADVLEENDRRRLDLNPLRLLDSNDPKTAELLVDAPKLVDYLRGETQERFAAVRAGLDSAGIPYIVDASLVRGLDYYTATTFEYASGALDSAQDALGGGGHYDGLVDMIGGPPLPGIGFGLGVERMLIAADAEHTVIVPGSHIDVVVAIAGDRAGVDDVPVRIVRELRAEGVRADLVYGDRSLKGQFRHADALGAAHIVVVGARDLADGSVTVRDMRTGSEERLARAEVAARLTRKIEEAEPT